MNPRLTSTKGRWIIIGSFVFVGLIGIFVFWNAHRVDSAITANLPEDSQALISTMGSSDGVVSSLAARKLIRRGDIVPLTIRLTDSNPRIRGECVHTLALVGNPSAIPHLAKMEHDTDPWVRRWVAVAMRSFNNHPEAKLVQERMKHDPDPSVQAEARGDWF